MGDMNGGNRMRNDMERRFAGKRAKLAGELFEKLIEASCRYYRDTGRAVIEKTPEPMKPLSGMDRQGRFQACFTKAAQPDYKGVLHGGRAVVFEAKHTDGDTIAYNRLTETQMDCMEAYHEMGALCFVLVSFGFQDFFRIPWPDWNDMPYIYGRKHLKRQELERFRVREKGNVLFFLEGVEQDA